jgi:CRP-like cAMP-binding protein
MGMENGSALNCKSCPFGKAAARCPFVPKWVPENALLCGQGEPPSSIFFVREGTVASCVLDENGVERSLSLRGPGALLGHEALRGTSAPAEVWALTPVRLCSASVTEIQQWLGMVDAPARVLLELILLELSHRDEDSACSRGDVLSRVARFLLSSTRGESGGTRLQRQLVARALGMRPETLSRCLGQLGARGLISRGAQLKVLDAQGLERIAQSGN